MANRLEAFIRLIAIVRSTSSFSSKTARAAWNAASGTPVKLRTRQRVAELYEVAQELKTGAVCIAL